MIQMQVQVLMIQMQVQVLMIQMQVQVQLLMMLHLLLVFWVHLAKIVSQILLLSANFFYSFSVDFFFVSALYIYPRKSCQKISWNIFYSKYFLFQINFYQKIFMKTI